MSVFARSDISAVSISPANGGCGKTHSRPVADGAPATVWQLTCPACENFLRSDPCWSVSPSQVPETPDEEALREDREKRGALEQQNAVNASLEQMAKLGQLPEIMAKFLEFARTGAVSAPAVAAEPEAEVVDGELASKQLETESTETADEGSSTEPEKTAEQLVTDGDQDGDGKLSEDELNKMSAKDVKAYADSQGVDNSGTKAQVIERLTAGE